MGDYILNKIAVVIPSCDNYSDVWEPFITNIFRVWPEIPFKIYLISNFKKSDQNKVVNIIVGDDCSWSSNLIEGLQYVSEEAVFLLIDDLFFLEEINKDMVLRLSNRFITENMNYLRFNPLPRPEGKADEDGIGEVYPGSLYRSSTIMSLWKKSVLIEALKHGESAWQFEIFGSDRISKHSNWYASRIRYIPFVNLVIKGKYHRGSYRKLSECGLQLGNTRVFMSRYEHFILKLKEYRTRFFGRFPLSVKQRIRRRLKASI